MGHRVIYLDTAAGIMLTYVIVYHTWMWSNLPLDVFWVRCLSFCMPWFFFKGGLVYRRKEIMTVVKDGWKRLMIPYIVFTLIGSVFLWLPMIVNGSFRFSQAIISSFRDIIELGSAYGNLALWFLLSLFVVRILFAVIQTRVSRKSLWLTIALPILFHLFKGNVNIDFPFYCSNILSGLAFYTLGFLLKDFKPSVLLFMSFMLVYMSSVCFFPQRVDMRSDTITSGCYIGWITMSLIGIVVINHLCRIFFNFDNLISWVGKNAMPFYCWHLIVLKVISFFKLSAFMSNNWYFILQLTIMAISLPALYFLQLRFEKLLHKSTVESGSGVC